MNENKEIQSEDDFFEEVTKKEVTLMDQIVKEKQLANLELIRLTRAKMKKAETTQSLITRASEILSSRLNPDPDNEQNLNDISTGTLILLIKELSKVDSDLLGSILQASKGTPSAPIGERGEVEPKPKEKEIKNISSEHFNKAKNVIDFINKIETSGEFPEVETDSE